MPKPPALALAAGFAINAGLRRALEGEPIDVAQMRSFLSLAKADQVQLETATLSYIADQRMKRAMVELQMSSGSLEKLDRALALARTLTELPFDLNLWQAQNIWYEILRTSGYALTALAADDRPRWEKDFNELGACLTIDTAAMRAGEQAERWQRQTSEAPELPGCRQTFASFPSLSAKRSPRHTMVSPAKPATHTPIAITSRSGSSHRFASTS